MSYDPKANYYSAGGIEVLDIIRAKLTPEQYIGYLLGTGLVYQLRFNFKHQTQEERNRDIEKANLYTTWLNNELKRQENEKDN